MTTSERIALNQRKHLRWKRCERVLRSIRLKIFDYDDAGKGDKASRVLAACQRHLAPLWQAQHHAAEERKYRNYMM